MDPRLTQLANVLSFSGVLLGLPAFAGTLFFGFSALTVTIAQRRTTGLIPYPKNADGVVLVIVSIAKVIGGAANLIGKVGAGIIRFLAVASLAALAFCSLLYFTGRGLDRHEDWARWVAFGLMVPLAVASAFGFISRGRLPLRLASLGVGIACGYAMHLLWTAFGAAC